MHADARQPVALRCAAPTQAKTGLEWATRESQIEPWLANADPLLRGAKVAGPKNANDDDSEISKENGNEKPCFGEQ